MIRIYNESFDKSTGDCLYLLTINNQKITDFFHKRKDGLAVCLEKAAAAVKKKVEADLMRHFESVHHD